jgi:hypothetical protein
MQVKGSPFSRSMKDAVTAAARIEPLQLAYRESIDQFKRYNRFRYLPTDPSCGIADRARIYD